jgi:hypothetical protein
MGTLQSAQCSAPIYRPALDPAGNQPLSDKIESANWRKFEMVPPARVLKHRFAVFLFLFTFTNIL